MDQPSSNTNPVQAQPLVIEQTPPQTAPQIPVQLAEHTPDPVQPPAPIKPKSKFPKKLIFIVVAVLILLAIIGTILMVVLRGNGGVGGILPIPVGSASPTPTATAAPTSPYVNDPEVMKIEEDLQALDSKLNSTGLREDTLRVPVLEWKVNF